MMHLEKNGPSLNPDELESAQDIKTVKKKTEYLNRIEEVHVHVRCHAFSYLGKRMGQSKGLFVGAVADQFISGSKILTSA